MRFVLAIVSFVVAAILIAAGVAQTTVLKPPSYVAASVTVKTPAPLTIIDGKTLNTFPMQQRLHITGTAAVFAAYGRTIDVKGWVGHTAHNVVTYDPATKQLKSTYVKGTEATAPNPSGSDLWLASYTAPSELATRVKLDPSDSVLIATDGTAPAPAGIRISWPLDDSTPWAAPLLLAGGVVLLLGLALLLWALAHVQRSRGPRRKAPKMPKLPKQPRYKPSKRSKAPPTSTRGRRSTRMSFVAAPIVAVSLVALAGCSVGGGIAAPAATPTTAPLAAGSTSTPAPEAQAESPAVTKRQASAIIQQIVQVAADADAKLDATMLATRFTGPALALREANYAIRKVDASQAAITAVPGDVELVLPQQNDGWPRTVFAVTSNSQDPKAPFVALMLIQDDARSQYKVNYAVNLEPGAVIDNVATTEVGTQRLPPDTSFLTMAPQAVAPAYGDMLLKDTASPTFADFDPTGDSLRPNVDLAAQKKAQAALPKTAKLTFSNAAGPGQVIAMASIDGGAIVAAELDETQTVKPVEKGAAVNAPAEIKALSGKAVSSKGLQAVYGDQLLFFVPSQTQGGLIKLLGYGQGLIAASEVK